DWNWQTRLRALRLGVKRLTEFHDIQTALAQRWPDWRGWIGLTSWHLQLNEADDFLRHSLLLAGISADPFDCRSASRGLKNSGLFDLIKIKLDRCCPTKNGHGNTYLAFLVIDIFDVAVEIGERTFFDADHFAHLEQDLGTWFF